MRSVSTLREASEHIDYGLTLSATDEPVGPRFLRITDIDSTHVGWESVPYCAASLEESRKYALSTGDIVIARTGASTGRSQWVEVDELAVFASYLVRFRISSRFDSRYISYVLQSLYWSDYVSSVAHGKSAQPNMSAREMADFEFEHPALSEQRAIAEVLGALDDKIAANSAAGATAWELARAEFLKLSTGATESRHLGDLVRLEYGKSLPATARQQGRVSVVGSGGIVGQHSESIVKQSGVVVGRKGSAGSVHWVDGPHWPIDTTFYAVPASPDVSQPYAYFLLETLKLDQMNSDSAVPGLNRKEAEAIKLRVPLGLERSRFTARAATLIEAATQMERESRALAGMRDTLLPELMSGRLRVKDAEKKVGEVF